MGRTTWIRSGLCLFAALVLLCMGLVLAESEALAPELSVNATAVCRGEVFEATVNAVEGADAYKVKLLDESGEMHDWAFEYDAGVFYICTAEATAGNYTLVAEALDESENVIGESEHIPVQVLDDSGDAGGIYFEVKHRENPKQNNLIYVSAYAPGADYVYIDWVGFDEFAADPGTPNGLILKVCDELGTQEFYAVATYPDGSVSRTESVTVNVESLPSAGEVTITDMPTHLAEGEDLSASYTVVRTGGVASDLRVKVFTADNWELVYDEALDGTGAFTIPATRLDDDGVERPVLEAGRLYEIYVILTPDDKANYGQAWENRNFAVVPAADNRVALRIADATDGAELDRGQEVPVAISAPGATAVRLRVGNENEDLWNWGEWEDWSQSEDEWNIQFDWSFWDKCVVYAEACFDADPWAEEAVWVRSNSVIVKTNTNGGLNVPLVQTSSSVSRGELLNVHVSDWDDRTEWRYAVLRDTDWNEIFWLDFYGDDPYLPTAQLEPGRYILNVGSGAAGFNDGVAMRWFEVTEPTADIFAESVYWNFTATEVPTHAEVAFSASAMVPDVSYTVVEVFNTELGFCCGHWESGECNTNNCVTGRFGADRAGNYEFVCYLYREGEENPFEVSSFMLNVTAEGTLDPVQLKLPGTLAQEQPLNGTIVPVEGAQWYSLNIGYNRDGEWEWFENHDQEADDLMIDYDGHWFNETGLYCLSVGAHAHGKNSSYADCYLVVNQEVSESVTLSLGCETETLNCVAHTELPMVVIAPGALNVEYFGGYEWRGIDHLESEFGYAGSESFDGGDFTVLARAKFEEEGEWIYSNPVIVHASMPGVLGVSNLTLASNHVKRGEPLVVSFTAVENASQYNVHIVNEDGQGYSHGFEPGTHKLSTSVLEEGTYTLIVNYCGSGYAWRSVEQTFTVTGAAPEEIVTFLGADEIKCNEKVLVSVYAPDANRIRIYEKDASNDEEWLYEECEGDRYTHNFHRDHPATVYYSASVSYDEGETWSEPVEIGTLRVTESLQLDKPEIKLSSTLISEGEGIEFSFGGVQNATIYSYSIRDNDVLNGRDQVMDGWFDEPALVRLPAELFRAGHTYRIDILVSAPGYETNWTTYTLAARPYWDGDITLYVNDETESAEGWVSEGFHVVVDAPENATAIIVSDGMDWRWQPGNHFEDDFWYDFNGEVTLIARYTVDEIDLDAPWWENAGWAGYSNPVTVRVNSYGSMPMVEADVPASAIRGDFMKIAVTNAETFLNGGYENLWLHAEAGIPEEGRRYGCCDWDGEGTILLPTAELEAGRIYELHVRVGADGYVGSTHVYTFSVNEPENGGIVFAIDKTEVITGEDFAVSIYAPGADQVKLFEGGWEIDWRDGAVYAQMHSHSEAAELRFHAEAHMPETGEWVSTETIAVTVTAPYGDLTAEELGLVMPIRLEADNALTIAWNDLGLKHYDVNIERVRDGVRVWHSWNDHGETKTTVPVEMPQEYPNMEPVLEPGMPVLEVGEFYQVNLDFQRIGWNGLHIEKQIVVVSDDIYAEGLTLFVDGQTDAFTTLVNVDVPVKITAPQNATAILAWNGYDWEMYSGNEAVFTWAWGDANERLLCARYTTDTIAEGKDWMEYGWSRVSNIVSVTTISNGSMPNVNAIVPESVMRGKLLEIQIANPSDFQGYDGLQLTAEAHFWNDEEDSWYGRFDWDGEGSILLPTAELPDGRTFELHVRASAPGYTESESVYEFTVSPLPEGTTIYFDVSKEEVETCEEFSITVFAPGADEVRIYENNREFDRREGRDFYSENHWCGEAGEYVFYAGILYPDGTWVQTPDMRVNVTAPNDNLAAEEVNLQVPARLEPNQELNISWAEGLELYHYDVEVHRIGDWERVWHSWNDHGENSVTVPAVMPDASHNVEQLLAPGETVLEAGEAYEVTLSVHRRGSNALRIKKQLLVTKDGMFDENIRLTVNGSSDVLEVPVNVDVPVWVAAPENATAIITWNGYSWDWHEGNLAETDWAWVDVIERMLYARYTTDPNADRDSDWNRYEWSGLSNVVTVNTYKDGDAPVPVVELSDATALRGDVISFTVQNTDDFRGFQWTVRDVLNGNEWDWCDWEGIARHEIDTFDLQTDRTYLLCVNNYGFAGMESTGVEVPFTVTANGMAAVPEVEVDASIAQGDVLAIRIMNPEAGDLFRAWFWQEETGTNFASDWNGEDTIYLPTFNLTAGVYTKLYVQNDGSYGLERSYTVLPIEVTEPSGKLSLCLEKTNLVTQEQTYIVAYASGAQSIRLYACHADEPDNPFWDAYAEEVVHGYWGFTGRSGKKIVTAVATYPDGSTQEQTMEVTVTAPEGDLPEPMIDAPDAVEPGEDLNFSVTAKDAEWWFVDVFDQSDDGRQLYHWDVDGYEESRGFNVPAGALVEGHTYGINVYAARYAWNEVGAYREFTVVSNDDPYAENVLRLPAALGVIEDEAFEGVSARTVVIPNGTSSIGSRAFADCGMLKYVEIPDSVTSIAGDAFAGSNVTFICNDGSTAYAYAQSHGIPVR